MDADPQVLVAAFEASPGNAAVLDAAGEIVTVNRGWREFASENELLAPDAFVGANYLDVCRDGENAPGAEAAEGLRALLDGESEQFGLEYPCHSPTQRRWFLMRAVGFDHRGDRYALVTHLDITDRKEAELEVRRREGELEDLVSLLAHDVRNPLGVATGWLEQVEPADDAEAEALERVSRSLERMEDTVDDALTFMEADAGPSDRELVDVSDLARRLWTDLGGDPERLAVADEVAVRCHPELCRHLLENLLANARQHGGESVRVTVGATPDGFYVADDGPGIDPSRREDVFDVGVSDSQAGTGFGLSIVKSVVDRHGWEIAVGESAEGGARFEVRTRPANRSGEDEPA